MDINKAFTILMEQEGTATTLTSNDRGGLTKFGIAQASHPGLDIANLTQDKAIEIYTKEYWTAASCPNLKPELQYMHFSCSVNCGVISAIKILQRACRVKDDGVVGKETLTASLQLSIQDYAIEWALHYKKIIEDDPTQKVFQEGWNNRINYILKLNESSQ